MSEKGEYSVLMRDGVIIPVSTREAENIKKKMFGFGTNTAINLRSIDTTIVLANVLIIKKNKQSNQESSKDVSVTPETLVVKLKDAQPAEEKPACCDNPDVTVRKRITEKGTTMYFPQCANCLKRFPLVAKKNVENPDTVLDWISVD